MTHATVRPATHDDSAAVLPLARSLATSFDVDAVLFESMFHDVVSGQDASLKVATIEEQIVGYVLAFVHPVFFANGPVAWVEEISVAESQRRRGIGRALMEQTERWAAERGAGLVALATRRAGPFYTALAYEDSATYFRKILVRAPGRDTSSN